LYLQSFRDDAAFAEAFAEQICKDISSAVTEPLPEVVLVEEDLAPEFLPGTVSVEVLQKPRGGVSIKANSVIAR
jgi:NADPH-dependent 7-cyano-7-deazaguanine reductase QueF